MLLWQAKGSQQKDCIGLSSKVINKRAIYHMLNPARGRPQVPSQAILGEQVHNFYLMNQMLRKRFIPVTRNSA